MSINSKVAFEIRGPRDKLNFLRHWAEDLFFHNEEGKELVGLDENVWSLRWCCCCIKWYNHLNYWEKAIELRQFSDIWRLSRLWGLDACFCEISEEGPTNDDFLGKGIEGMYITQKIMTPW